MIEYTRIDVKILFQKEHIMEKHTIGKFIAVLRKANGMTQKELGEKLFVSDKTVSRWECDECEPELSVLPAMAELFGVTVDELIRGERTPATRVSEEPVPEQLNQKTEKQLKRMLQNRLLTYKNRLFLSLGISAFGFLVAVFCNFAFYRGILGFCLSAVAFVASILTICVFSDNAYLKPDDEDFFLDKQTLLDFHSSLTKLCVKCVTACIGIFASTLPFAFVGSAYYGLDFLPWLCYAALSVGASLLLCFLLYKLFAEKYLVKREFLRLSEREVEKNALYKKALRRYGTPCGIVFLVLCLASFVFAEIISPFSVAEKKRFTDYEPFKQYIETYEEDELWKDLVLDGSGSESNYHTNNWQEIQDEDGNVLYRFEWNNRSVLRYEFSDSSYRLPVIVYTKEAVSDARDTLDTCYYVCLLLMFTDAVTFTSAYLIAVRRKK